MIWKVVMASKDLGFNYTDESFNELEVTFQHKDCQSEAEIMEFSREADAMIARGSSQPLPGSVISKLVNCRIIASLGVGYENLDVAAERALGHYTHEKNPVSCAAALATIDYIETHKLVNHARQLGRHSLKRLNAMKKNHGLIGDVRGLGLFLGIELVKNRQTRKRAGDEAEAVLYTALSKGVSFKLTMGNILTLTPSLTITKKEMDTALDIIEESIAEVEKM